MHANYRINVMTRIEGNSIKRDTGCIEYAGGSTKHKYGLVSITIDGHRKSVPASRAYYMAVNNCFDLPSSTQVCHTCDNPCCVNIGHLFAGTAKVNTQDMIAKGRKAKHYKPHTRQRKFTDEQIIAIRECKWKPKYIAMEYGVSSGYISKLKSGKAKTLV